MTIEEYRDQAEELGASLSETVEDAPRDPNGPDGPNDLVSSGVGLVDAEGGFQRENAWKYWTWDSTITFAKGSGTSPKDAADRMAEALDSNGWTGTKDPGETVGTYEYRRPDTDNSNGWYVQLSFRHRSQQLHVKIVSPSTDASDGTSAAARQFDDVAWRLETMLATGEQALEGERLSFMFGSKGSKAEFLDAMTRWKTAATEIREFIRAAREDLGLPSSSISLVEQSFHRSTS
ncbi:hypothetical protein [Myceligenerans crystallogenes]|uniref:Uncharacterized protein n=1 Tax=Myceligenerans crystallogenes TaxID=316335 RepID=A0ABN2NAW5_9MICO